MSCEHEDLKAYLFGEVNAGERRKVEEHLRNSPECREELDRLRQTREALMSLPEEEPSRRFSLPLEKVVRRDWRESLRLMGLRPAFVGAWMIAIAILAHGIVAPPKLAIQPRVNTATIEKRIQEEVDRRIEVAVTKAVAESEARQAAKTAELLKAVQTRMEMENRANLLSVQEGFEVLSKRMNVMMVASNDVGSPQ